ncbi:hypothetical protein [Anabaena sp. PCC 7108]|uniref:hypothetical protein n=1 Tax=Anabaena sp. PCC 7108 TaxID=163908 RepID=UPI000347ECC0|nr:hypothetical protein [Anabaena sp. PCC 7108]
MTSEKMIQKALQWWSYRQAIKLFLEAEKIRDGLLQESFTIRRSLDVLAIDNLSLSIDEIQECSKKIENFHHSLVQLSDRLCPTFIQDSLPLSIEYLLEPWLSFYPHSYFHIDMPDYWRYEPIECSLIILRALEELLIITLPKSESLIAFSMYIRLKKIRNMGQLVVKISYPDISTLILHSQLPELEYLYHSFNFLISGKCLHYNNNLRSFWHFYW